MFEFGELDGHLFLTMEYLRGGSLRDALARDGALAVDRAVEVAQAVADALEHVHEVGLVHRDVKPSNILLDAGGRVVLADFGLVRGEAPADARLTRSGQLLGTPVYLAPELLAGGEATRASDVYALGVVLYEALAGHHPFQVRDVVELLDHVREERYVPLRLAAPQVPRPLARIVERAMSWDPTHRYAEARAMRDALPAFAQGAPVSDSLGLTLRARGVARRNPMCQ